MKLFMICVNDLVKKKKKVSKKNFFFFVFLSFRFTFFSQLFFFLCSFSKFICNNLLEKKLSSTLLFLKQLRKLFYFFFNLVYLFIFTVVWLSSQPNSLFVEPISSEKACRCLARITLLSRLRENIIPHPEFENRIKLCQMTFDMPSWWIVGKHDKELVLGAAK